jgi:hypothetical protein
MELLGVPRTPEPFTDRNRVAVEATGACNLVADACGGRTAALVSRQVYTRLHAYIGNLLHLGSSHTSA